MVKAALPPKPVTNLGTTSGLLTIENVTASNQGSTFSGSIALNGNNLNAFPRIVSGDLQYSTFIELGCGAMIADENYREDRAELVLSQRVYLAVCALEVEVRRRRADR